MTSNLFSIFLLLRLVIILCGPLYSSIAAWFLIIFGVFPIYVKIRVKIYKERSIRCMSLGLQTCLISGVAPQRMPLHPLIFDKWWPAPLNGSIEQDTNRKIRVQLRTWHPSCCENPNAAPAFARWIIRIYHLVRSKIYWFHLLFIEPKWIIFISP